MPSVMKKDNPDEYDDTGYIYDDPVDYAHIKVKIPKSIYRFSSEYDQAEFDGSNKITTYKDVDNYFIKSKSTKDPLKSKIKGLIKHTQKNQIINLINEIEFKKK